MRLLSGCKGCIPSPLGILTVQECVPCTNTHTHSDAISFPTARPEQRHTLEHTHTHVSTRLDLQESNCVQQAAEGAPVL